MNHIITIVLSKRSKYATVFAIVLQICDNSKEKFIAGHFLAKGDFCVCKINTKSSELISIIVSVYNVEKYLSQCIDSILAQTYGNIEIILVDDGSEDNSGKICDEYSLKDDRIKVIHKVNGGPASARKVGLEIAHGAYVGFVDSDDWIDKEMYQHMLEYALENAADIVSSGWVQDAGAKKLLIVDSVEEGLYIRGENYERIIRNLIMSEDGNGGCMIYNLVCRLFKRELIKIALETVDVSLSMGEDAACSVKAFLMAQRVYVTKHSYYHYRLNSESLTHVKNGRLISEYNEMYNNLRKVIEEHAEYKRLLLPKAAYTITRSILCAMEGQFDWGDNIRVHIDCERVSDELWETLSGRIVLCGAGKWGQRYHDKLQHNAQCTVVAWLDSNAALYADARGIKPLEYIREIEYDWVVLGVKFPKVAEDIKQMLLKLGAAEDKIVWHKTESMVKVYDGEGKEWNAENYCV